MDNIVKQLSDLLVGKTIERIENPNASEAIAKFVMTDGTAFRLHATNLGAWIEKTVAKNKDDLYSSLTDLIADYDYETKEPPIYYDEEPIRFVAPNGKQFRINHSALTQQEGKIIELSDGLALLLEAFSMGDCWKLFFRKGYLGTKNIPSDLFY